ncbi:MAG: InlB B-repeat-containing protein [Acholeplasmataceae bacterium]|nr:InlB B-repeat-containing protein [Acholeplasmataceae bacterium]
MNKVFKVGVTFILLMVTVLLVTGCNEKEITITFDSTGGSDIEVMTVKTEEDLVKPIDPTKEGYTFKAWYLDESLSEIYLFEAKPKDNITLYAKWDINRYTMSFETNGGNPMDSIIGDYNQEITNVNDPVKEGYSFIGWYSDIDLTNAYTISTMPSKDITLYAKWAINSYTISFQSNGGSGVVDIKVPFGSMIIAPNNPVKENYLFMGWYEDINLTNEFVFTTMPSSDITLYAKWEEDPKGLIFLEDTEGFIVTGYNGKNVDVVIPSIFKSKPVIGISDSAFSNRNDIISIYVPSSVKTIGNKAFNNLTSLTTFTVEEKSQLTSIGDDAFNNAKSLVSFTLPRSVTTIGVRAFQDTLALSSFIFESDSQLEFINDDMFNNAQSLTSITLPVGITSIGNQAFQYAMKLESINIPNTVKSLGDRSFYEANSLISITFEDNSQLTSIGNYAFLSAYLLPSIVIPRSVETMGMRVFYFDRSLTIYAEIESKPEGWSIDWNPSNRPVIWGYTK